eukprot:8759925-Pyramimonas_sp.AAC.1
MLQNDEFCVFLMCSGALGVSTLATPRVVDGFQHARASTLALALRPLLFQEASAIPRAQRAFDRL